MCLARVSNESNESNEIEIWSAFSHSGSHIYIFSNFVVLPENYCSEEKNFLQTYKKANQLTSRWQFEIQFVNMQRTFAFASTICAIWLLEKTFSFFYHLKQKPEKKKSFQNIFNQRKKRRIFNFVRSVVILLFI